MNRTVYAESLQATRQRLMEAEMLLTEIANENVFGEREFLETTDNIDDVALHLHRAMSALRRAYKNHIDVLD